MTRVSHDASFTFESTTYQLKIISEKVYWVEEEWMLTYVYQIIRRDSKVSASVPSTQGT